MRAAAAMLFACLPLTLHAQALPLTVGEMHRACATITAENGQVTPENAVAVGACFGAMRGVVQVMQANCRSFAVGQRPAPALSVGEIPSPAAAIAAFADWVEAHHDQTEAPAEYGIIVALARAFPCRRAMGGPAPRSPDEDAPAAAEPEEAPDTGEAPSGED